MSPQPQTLDLIIPIMTGEKYEVQTSSCSILCHAFTSSNLAKSKSIPRQAEVAQGVPGRLRPRIISTFGTTRVVGHQPNAPAAFTPGEIPGTHFQRLSRPQGTWHHGKNPK